MLDENIELVEPMRPMTHDPLVALYSDTIIKI
jgi:hypothetical protein